MTNRKSKLLNSPIYGEVLVVKLEEEPVLVVAWQDDNNQYQKLEFEFTLDSIGWSTLDKSFDQARDDNIDYLIGVNDVR